MLRMKPWLTIFFFLSAIWGRAFSQEGVIETSVCQIMQHPEQFEGKVLKIRAQIWTDHDEYWLNESAATSIRLNAFCGWLPAKFSHPTSLVGCKAFATFTGRLISDPGSSWRHVRFLIEGDADIYRQEVMNGLVLVPQLYDQRVNAFVQPQHYPIHARSKRHGTPSPLCYWPSFPEGIVPEMQFPVTPPTVCGYICNGDVPIRVCTKG